ncbi:MAG: hypothetical protein MSD82_03535 [Prevotella sp.]|nr:hypothetical protein [Prevotella sp.]
MRKFLLMFVAATALVLASCGNKTNAGAAKEADSAAVDSGTAAALAPELQGTFDALTNQLTSDVESKNPSKIVASLANLQVIFKNLVESGKLEEAKSYGNAIKQFVSDHADAIKSAAAGNATIASLIEGVQNLPTSAEATAEDAKAAVVSDVTKLASPAVAKGATTIENAKAAVDAVKDAPDAAKAAVETKANEQAAKAKQKAGEAVDKAASKANDAVNSAKDKLGKGLGL